MTNNLPFQMIATDLDRTLLLDDETLSVATIEAIRRAKGNGFLFVVATARSLYSTMLVARDLCPDAVIHTGGAYAVVGDQVIYRAVLSPEDTVEAAHCLGALVFYEMDDGHYFHRLTLRMSESKEPTCAYVSVSS